MVDLAEILTDLNAESQDLDRLVAPLPEADWARPTPSPGWTIAHQIAHLTWTDELAVLAATDAPAFHAVLERAMGNPYGFVDDAASAGITEAPALLVRWRASRSALAEALTGIEPGTRLPWILATVSPAMMATARFMETWAHGEDVAEALGMARLPTDRLKHVAYLGFRTMGHSFASHGRPIPTEPVYVELVSPSGQTWAFGPTDAENRMLGPALDFCLLVTQRAHPDDLALEASGPVARQWLTVAQAFAGPPGGGRKPRTTPP